ncbi:hypothetical protein GF354_04495 [Candidatus Peregrinibacteria bacterium]|nr:hypothetical protein [Candidatus Peregrinibacteria bacterium]
MAIKTVLFADSHKAEREKYKKLLDTAINERASRIKFLGDADGYGGYSNLMGLKLFAAQAGIEVDLVRGNHDQAWLDYANGEDKRCVTSGETDFNIKHDKQI